MYVYYIDKYQKIISGTSNEELDLFELKIPIIIRHYVKLDTYAVQIGDDKNIPITHTHRKKDGMFKFYHGYLQCVGEPIVINDWVPVLTDVPQDIFGYVLDIVKPYVSYWANVHTNMAFPTIHPDRCNLGINLYFKDKTIANIANCTVYCFGKCQINKESLSNVLIFAENELGGTL